MKKILAVLLTALMMLGSVSAMADSLFPWPEEGLTLTVGIPQSNNVTDYENNYVRQYVKEKTGINIEFVLYPSASSDYKTKLNLQIASGEELPDILSVGINATTAYQWGQEGVLVPLNDWYAKNRASFDAYCERAGVDANAVLLDATSPDGNIYAAPYYSSSYNNVHSLRAWINMTWLEKLGLEVPTTTEEFYNVLVAFRDRDPNGNGIADEIPLMGCDAAWYAKVLDWLQNPFIYCQPREYYKKEIGYFLPLSETDGVLDVSYDKDAYREFLIYANKLIKEGLLSPQSFTMDTTQWAVLQKMAPAQVGVMVSGGAANIIPGVVEDTYDAFTCLIGPGGEQHQSIMPTTGYPYSAVTKFCDHPEAAMALINMLYDEVAGPNGGIATVARYGEEGVDWRMYDPAVDTDIISSVPGFDPGVIVIENQWGVPTNKLIQHHLFSMVADPGWWIAGVKEGEVTANVLFGRNWELNIQYGPAFSDIVADTSFLYTDEEEEEWADVRFALREYIKESRTRFALGEMDPNSDADWNAYLQELNNLDYQGLLEVCREAYARKQATAQ